MRLLKLEDKYTGWSGEECWRPHGRRFIKRLEHRYNRRFARRQIRSTLHDC
jgi:hypothetical protein